MRMYGYGGAIAAVLLAVLGFIACADATVDPCDGTPSVETTIAPVGTTNVEIASGFLLDPRGLGVIEDDVPSELIPHPTA